MKTVASALSARNNNFDALRLLAALVVLWSHSYPLTAHSKDEIFSKILFGYDDGGSIAVTIFFVISGFLITKSASERDTSDYLIARALRILPGLALVVVATTLVIGPLLTNLSLVGYLRDHSTVSYLRNIRVFGVQYDLPSATAGLIYPGAINGSLWTLSLECGFYVIIAALFNFGLFTERNASIVVVAVVSVYFYCSYCLGYSWSNQGPMLWKGASLYLTAKYGSAFFLGGALWVYRKRAVLSCGMAVTCAIALFAAAGTASAVFVHTLSIPYLVIYFAIGVPITVSLKRVGDLSYGTYLFAFPIQQAIIFFLGPTISATKVSLLATPIVLMIAYCSWWFVEKPLLSLKGTGMLTGRAKHLQRLGAGSAQV